MAYKKAADKRKAGAALTEQSVTKTSKSNLFSVVGVGASAGGLEAFTQLLKNMPPHSGIAFVLIQHLAPSHESMLTELLSKASAIPVREVKDGMAVEPDNVYVIPPDREMLIFQGVLHLSPRGKTKGQYMPVDSFLRSLAEDRGNNAIAVIMSGTGSDGSMGIRAIKGEGGIVFAQDETAKYDGMPRSAVDTGCVDFVMPPNKIAAELIRIRRHPYLAPVRHAEVGRITQAEENDLNKIFGMLRSARGVDFTYYKRSTIMRRVTRRMMLQKIEGIENYVASLKENPSEIETLYQDILINVTSFFRDPGVFDALKKNVFPHFVNKASADVPVRIWVPACSTGEEAYSIAISLMEYMDANKSSRPVQIFATDIDEVAVEKARRGIYPENISKDVSPERLRRFFEKTEGGYIISKSVREMCIFAKHNIIKDPPFSRVDLISCRNVLIYFGPDLQKKALQLLFYALSPKGFLMIGPSETLGEFAGLFSVVDKKNTIYAKKAGQAGLHLDKAAIEYVKEKSIPGKNVEAQSLGIVDIQREADTIVLSKFSPAGFVVNESMKILQFRGDTSPYLRPAPGEASLNLLKMVCEELVTELRTAIHQAKKENVQFRKERVRFKHNNREKYINIDVVPFKAPASGELCFLILFEESLVQIVNGAGKGRRKRAPGTVGPAEDEEAIQLRQELATANAHLRTVAEEYEAANEELRALNEELQSSNEEMQSINEELETAKEELQSTNEELTTVNDELQSRNEEMRQLNNDLVNVLRGVEIPIVLLGSELQIRRFNDAAGKMLNLIPADVGRPIGNIRTNISIPDLEQMVPDVINTLAIKEREVQDVSGRWYSFTIRPYKTVDNRIEGVLMTIVDINDMKLSLLRIKKAYDYANDIVETVREPLIILDSGLKVITANRSFYENFLVDPEDTEGCYIYDLGNGQWDIPDFRKLLYEILPEQKSFTDFEVTVEIPNIGPRTMTLNARAIRKEESYPTSASKGEKDAGMILLAIEDITERKKMEEALRASSERYRSYIEVTGELGWTTNADGEVVEDLPSWRRYTGQTYEEMSGQGWSNALHPDDVAHTLQIWGKAVSGKSNYEVEYRIRRHDGIYRDFMVRGNPVLKEDGSIREWVGTCIDITERKLSEEEIRRLNVELKRKVGELEASNKDWEMFSHAVSHELRSPLFLIDGLSGIVSKKYAEKVDVKGREQLTTVREAAKKMGQLLDDLFAFSRARAREIRADTVNIEEIAQHAFEELKPGIGNRNIQLKMKPLPSCQGDSSLLRQVFVNLFANAIKFTGPREIAFIEVGGIEKGEEIEFYVKDNGVGFDMEYKDKLFNIFQRLHSLDDFEGTGTGLAIVRRIIEKHGGKVWAESKPGEGATFYFTLPGINAPEKLSV